MKLVHNTEDEAIERLAKVIIKETTDLKRDQTIYNTRISLAYAMLKLSSRLSLKHDGNLTAAMAGNIVIMCN